jgi:hypothetical protein
MIAVCFTVIAIVSACPLARSQSVKSVVRQARVAIKNLDEHPESVLRSVQCLEALGDFDDGAVAAALIDIASDLAGRMASVRKKRRKGLLGEGGSGRLKRSRYQLRNLEDAVFTVLKVIDQLQSSEALAVMLKSLSTPSSTLPLWLQLQLARRMADVASSDLPLMIRGKKTKPVDSVIALLAACASLGHRAATNGEWVSEQLQHENPDVRVYAAQAVGRIAWPPGIELLIDRLDFESGNVQDAVLEALRVLTSANPGHSSSSWRAWLEAEGGPYVRGEKKLSVGNPKPDKPKVQGQTQSGSYFGIAQDGESILYVFDNSQSMQAKMGKTARGKGAKSGGDRPTRWDLCRSELRSGLLSLKAHQKFNLVSFANKARSFSESMQEASEENVERAIEWIGGLKLEFQTNVFDALDLSFLLAGRGVQDHYYQSEVDTMFVLSDGAPTISHLGKSGIGPDDSERILRSVRMWNSLDRIKVHAVGIGLQKRKSERNKKGALWPAVFLRKLATQNGGRFVLKR